MRKVSVISLVFAFLLMFIAIVPVLAESPKKIPVIVTRTGVTFVQGDYWYTEGDIFHVQDATAAITTYIIAGEGISLIGSGPHTVYDGNLNLKTGIGQQTFILNWYFQVEHLLGQLQLMEV